MDTLAILSQLLPLALASFAVVCCVRLFRRRRESGWLLLAAVFLQPFGSFLARALHGRPLLIHSTTTVKPGHGALVRIVSYHFDFPVLLIIAVVGVYLLGREARHDKML